MRDTYNVKELFWTLQGEGSRAGTAAVFVRFTGCNLWDGHDAHRDRGTGACAKWCDTDFAKGTTYHRNQLLGIMDALWPAPEGLASPADGGDMARQRWCVLTGGEPLLQVDADLVNALHAAGWCVAIETNGTRNPLAGDLWPGEFLLDWFEHVTVSPKLLADGAFPALAVKHATDLKVVLPGHVDASKGWTPEALALLEELVPAEYRFVQAMDPTVPLGATSRRDAAMGGALRRCVDFIRERPWWRLSTQVHKTIGMP